MTAIRVAMPAEEIGKYVPGSYYFLNIPAVSNIEWHPISVSEHVSKKGDSYLMFHVKSMAHNAWSYQLSTFAGATGSATPTIAVDGPFGCLTVDPVQYHVISLFCGGIGVTPLLPTLEYLLDEKARGRLPLAVRIEFHWSVRGLNPLVSTVFADRLTRILHDARALEEKGGKEKHHQQHQQQHHQLGLGNAKVHPGGDTAVPAFTVQLQIYNTGRDAAHEASGSGSGSGALMAEEEPHLEPPARVDHSATPPGPPEHHHKDKPRKGKDDKDKRHKNKPGAVLATPSVGKDSLAAHTVGRRPDIAALIANASSSGPTVCALVCGPTSLSNSVVTEGAKYSNVHVHKETFGY